MSMIAAVLEPVDEGRVALQSVDIRAHLRGLLSEVEVTQTYRNLEDSNIEAVYTFPMPLDAVLLELTMTLNGKTLNGVVQPRSEAEETYENAMDEGDSAVLLQQIEPGVFTLNVGNLLSNETATIRYRYAQLHRWLGDSLRFHLPTTIAPRYGDPAAAGYAPHEVPEYALSADYGFSLQIQIEGPLAQADFECPSHPVSVSDKGEVRQLSLSGGSALMDRDFVLVLREPVGAQPQGLWAADGQHTVALASFHPAFPDDLTPQAKCIKLVVDCSGSMGGDSIAQAKMALHEIIGNLRAEDYFNITAFGSHHDLLFHDPVPADANHRQAATRYIDQLDANMGGTEIGAALKATYASPVPQGLSADVLLITDGEVFDQTGVLDTAKRSGHRIFSVGVGSAVSEAFVRQIAEHTAGVCELVSPREDMAEKIVRHFRRLDQPRAKSVTVQWPDKPVRQTPKQLEAVYAGDTVHVFGWLSEPPTQEVTLNLTLEDGRTITQSIGFVQTSDQDNDSADTLARVAAHARLQGLKESEAKDLAVEYQLVTQHTSCVMVYAREADEKAEEVPALRKVPQTMAAGWGGMGSIMSSNMMVHESRVSMSLKEPSASRDFDYLDIPAFLRRQDSSDDFVADEAIQDSVDDLEAEKPLQDTGSIEKFIHQLNARYPQTRSASLHVKTIDELEYIGLGAQLCDELRSMVEPAINEQTVVITFLVILFDSDYVDQMTRHVKSLIRKAAKTIQIPHGLKEKIERLV